MIAATSQWDSADSIQLRKAILQNKKITTVLENWRQARAVGFGIAEKNDKTTWLLKHLFNNYIQDPHRPRSTADMQQTLPLPASYTGIDRGYLSWMVAMYQVIKGAPELMSGQHDQEAKRYSGQTAEDWYRSYEICRYYWRAHTESRKGATDVNKKKLQNQKAQIP